MQRNISAGDLQAFVSVATHLNFRIAADELSISASALSRRLQKLESALGVQLLVRTTREVRLTAAGMQVYLRSQEVLTGMDEILGATGKANRSLPGVAVACTNSHAQTLVPRAAAQLNRRLPDTPIRVIGGNSTEVLDAVRRGDADLGISDMGVQESSLEFVPAFQERVVVAMPLGHRLAGRREVRWAELRKERYVSVWRGAPIRTLLDFELARARMKISIFHEVRNQHTALGFVSAGLGVSATTELIASSFSGRLCTSRLVSPEIVCPRALIRRKGRAMHPSAQVLWDILLGTRDGIPQG